MIKNATRLTSWGAALAVTAAFLSSCSTASRRSETDSDKQAGYFVDYDSTHSRQGVGNYVDRISWGTTQSAPEAPAPAKAAAPAKMDSATATQVNKILESINTNLYFPVGSSKLNAKQKSGMKSLADVLKNYKGSTIYITGYTDSTGSAEKNKILSEKRAQSVTDELVKHGIAREQILPKGAGQEADAGTASSKANSRRVSLSVE